MFTNADITLYLCKKEGSKKTYSRVVVEGVFWDSVESSLLLRTGQKGSVSVRLFIPLESLDKEISFTPGEDLVVKGIVEDTIDSGTEKELAESLAALKAKYKYRTVVTAEDRLYGSESMWHYELTCK